MRAIDADALIKELKHSFDYASATGYIRKLNELQKTDIIKIVFSTIDNAPTVTPIDDVFSTAVDKYGDNSFSVSVISSKGEKIEFERVKTGEWIPTFEMEEVYEEMFICSNCKHESFAEYYCPNCGAKMKGEEE